MEELTYYISKCNGDSQSLYYMLKERGHSIRDMVTTLVDMYEWYKGDMKLAINIIDENFSEVENPVLDEKTHEAMQKLKRWIR